MYRLIRDYPPEVFPKREAAYLYLPWATWIYNTQPCVHIGIDVSPAILNMSFINACKLLHIVHVSKIQLSTNIERTSTQGLEIQ